MNNRVLELLKNPKNIQSEDLRLLKEEINSFPYIQNIRALHLYGVHLYDKENYQKELSTTAAYTTDKKILYQLINGKIEQKPKAETVENVLPLNAGNASRYFPSNKNFPIKRERLPEKAAGTPEHVSDEYQASKPEIKHIYVNGERNRILFEGEENFLEETGNEVIDLDSTLEAGTLVTQKQKAVNSGDNVLKSKTGETKTEENKKLEASLDSPDSSLQDAQETQAISAESVISDDMKSTVFTHEKIISEDKIDSEAVKREVTDENEISFHGTSSFMEETQILPGNELNEAEEKERANKSEDLTEDASKASFESSDTKAVQPLEAQETQAISAESVISNDMKSTEFTPEEIINEDKIDSKAEKEKVSDETEISFHGTSSFMPGVKIQSTGSSDELTKADVSRPGLNKHEEEMRRLIEEVEKKMKATKSSVKEKEAEQEVIAGHDINFAETQAFQVEEKQQEDEKKEAVEDKVQPDMPISAVKEASTEIIPEKEPEIKSSWKPMSFESNIPDSLINKPVEVSEPRTDDIKEELPEPDPVVTAEEKIEAAVEQDLKEQKVIDEEPEEPKQDVEEKGQEAPVMNVSFFSSDISSWTTGTKREEQPAEEKDEQKTEISQETPEDSVDSNIPGFINTWQSWLKIDRTETAPEKDKAEIKSKVIESFIENNPKISQLKEESNFVVKEKNDDISHLMTETLANLYFEQKLYTKAIKAFELLANKHPEKKAYFEDKIQEVKDIRGKN